MSYPDGFDQSALRNKPICGVLAVAIAANVSYHVAHAACKRNLPSHRQRFGGKTYDSQRDKALSSLGIGFRSLYTKHNLTIGTFCQHYAEPDKVYLVEIRWHVMTYKNGLLIDQTRCEPWQSYPRQRCHVKRIVEITGSAWPKGD